MKHDKLKGSKDKRVQKKNMKKGAKLIVWKFLKRRHFLLCVVYFDNGHSMPRNIEASKNREFCG